MSDAVTTSTQTTPASADEIIHLAMVQHLLRGQEHHVRGRIEEAISAYKSGLDAAGDGAANHLVMTTKAAACQARQRLHGPQ